MNAVKKNKDGRLKELIELWKTQKALKKDALDMYPALQAMGKITVKADPNFTSEATGFGDIEYYDPGSKRVVYPTGEVFKHPGPNKRPAVLVNPETNNAQNVALDLLHGLPNYDSRYKELREEFGKAIEKEIKAFYDEDLKNGHPSTNDGYEWFRENFIDGKIRNFLFEGTPEDFARARYNPSEKTDLLNHNPSAYKAAANIFSYLKGKNNYTQ